jgi:lipopolysaccharide/colanic/teichoic acid biosynthesis glycosyltransferase
MMPLARATAPNTTGDSAAIDRALVLDEAMFRTVIDRERKRADRFGQKVVLLLVSAAGGPAIPVRWSRIAGALGAVRRPSDVIGWFARDTVLGIILPDVTSADASLADELLRRFRRQLDRHLGPGDALRLSIRLRVHPGPWTVVERVADAPPRERIVYPLIKRACDVFGSATGLLLLSPLLVIVAALVKLSSKGPVFFRQARVGHKEQSFTMFKFRTMCVGADPALHQAYVSSFIHGGDGATTTTGGAAPFKIVHDPRVTRIGSILRKTSIDELPQLWNVLRGEMSLVGPRPPLDYEVEQYEPWHRRRVMDVKPGLTGLWQVTGRSCTTFDQMVRLDLRYAKTCSLWGDLKILLATPAAVISGKGAR